MTEHDTDLEDDIDEPEGVEVLNDEPGHPEIAEDALASGPSALSRRDPLGVVGRG